jgi:hypothetical protein
MTTATITKTIAKVNAQPAEYSIGFKRFTSLPANVHQKMALACVLRGESNKESMKALFNGMTDQEFINWMKFA